MTRQDLIDILKQDGTQQQIEEYVATKELTEQERDRIYEFLRTDDPEEANIIFEEIMEDVLSKPVYETGRDEKKGWADLRIEIAEQIKDLKQAEFECQERLEDYGVQLQELEERFGSKMADHFAEMNKDALQKDAESLSIKTKQHSALALMHSEARSMEAQARARIFVEATQPYRDALANTWHAMSDRVTSTIKHTVALGITIHKTNDLDYHPIKDTVNKIRLAHAKSHIKDLNSVEKKIAKKEQKLINRANKISKREFRKNEFLNTLESWSKGIQPPVTEFGIVQNADQAIEVLRASDSFSDKKLEAMEAALGKLKDHRDDIEQKANRVMERVAQDLKQRRSKVQQIAHDVVEKAQKGDLGKTHIGMKTIEKNIRNGMESTFLQESSLDQDLQEFMRSHGFEDLIEGYQAPIVQEPQAPEFVNEFDDIEKEQVLAAQEQQQAGPGLTDEIDVSELEAGANELEEIGVDDSQELPVFTSGDYQKDDWPWDPEQEARDLAELEALVASFGSKPNNEEIEQVEAEEIDQVEFERN